MVPEDHQGSYFLLSFFSTMDHFMVQNGCWNASHQSHILRGKQKEVGEVEKCSLPAEFKQSSQKLHTVFLLKSHGPEFTHRGTPSYKGCWEVGLINASLTHTDTKVHMHTYISVTKERRKECELPSGVEQCLTHLLPGTRQVHRNGWEMYSHRRPNIQERKSFSLSLLTLFLYLCLNLHCICQSLNKSRLISQTFIAF